MSRWHELWDRLTEPERREACLIHATKMQEIPEGRAAVQQFLARACNTTPGNVARWEMHKVADRLSKAGGFSPENTAGFVCGWLTKAHNAMLVRFLDILGAPHSNGVMDVRLPSPPAPKEVLVDAVRAIQAEFPAREVELYLDALETQRETQNTPLVLHLAAARREAAKTTETAAGALLRAAPSPATGSREPSAHAAPERPYGLSGPPAPPGLALPGLEVSGLSGLKRGWRFQPPTVPITTLASPSVSDTVGPAPGHDLFYADPEALSALDRLLRSAVTAAAANVPGALPLERLREAIEEVRGLNAERHRSYYHLGFLDVLQGRPPDPDFPRASERHRGWYICGAIHALERRGDRAGVGDLFERHPGDVRRLLGDRHEAAAEAALPLFEALVAGDRRADAVRALATSTVARVGAPLLARLLEESAALLRAGRAAEASPLLTLVEGAFEVLRKRGLPVEAPTAERAQLQRGLAQRLVGAFDAAKDALMAVLGSSDPATVASAEVGLGLALCRVRSASEVRLPPRASDLAATARTLAPGLPHFERAAALAGPGRILADHVLGVLRLAEGRTDHALPHLERAAADLAGEDLLDEGHGVPDRVRLGLGLALAESLDAGRAAEAGENVVRGARGVPQEAHPWLLARALVALTASRPEAAADATRALHAVLGDRLLDAALEAGLLPTHEPLREALAASAEDAARPRRARSAASEALVRDALAAGDLPRAVRGLGVLEDLADDAEGRALLLALLADRSRYDPAWGADEALDSRVRLLEAEGRYREAAAALCVAGHEALSRDAERGLHAVDDLLERIAGYGIEVPDTALLPRRDALRAAQAPTGVRAQGPEPAGLVYVIGGNETQERYEEWLRAEAGRRWPRVTLAFDFTGWSSNWGRELPGIEARIRSAQSVVILRFIRTMLGRAVRSMCGTHRRPWVACTGHGRQSLLLAIEDAALLGRASATPTP